MLDLPMLFKVLRDGASFHGGDHLWSLPTQQPDGTWAPGDWAAIEGGAVIACSRGFHLTSKPAEWWANGATAFIAEGRGDSDLSQMHEDDGKVAYREARLLRPATEEELAAAQVFSRGKHAVTAGSAIASGSASVRASGSASVRAFDSASVEASGSASVEASGSASVRAFGSASVRASGSASVRASGSASVITAWGAPTVTTEEDSVWIDRCGPRPVVHGLTVVLAPAPESAPRRSHPSTRYRLVDLRRHLVERDPQGAREVRP